MALRLGHGRPAWLAVTTTVAALAFATPALASPASHAPRHSFGRSTSTNWSGYAVTGSGGADVKGTWTQPSVSCSPGENSWSSPWVGIDGDTSNTVEQIGTDSDCRNGSPIYYAWYEMYPKGLVTLSLAVHPGDSFTGEVTGSSSGNFVLTLRNGNTGALLFQTTQSSKRARRSSVEWIMEGPSSGLLSNFGSVPFGAASATIGGTTANLGSLNPDRITMVTNQGVPRAVPSPVSGGTSFSVSWQHS
jgi:Peptidase A4 family